MPSIRDSIAPRQKLTVEARGDLVLSELREKILNDFEYIANVLYTEFRKQYFTAEDFAKAIREKYGISKARIIANSLFDLVDPNGTCVKHRGGDSTGKTYYSLANGNFKEYMRRPIIKAKIMHNITKSQNMTTYTGFVSLTSDDTSNIALKLLSIFDYVTYEVAGGEEPEIFIRLNDPNKIRDIVMNNTYYSNNYVTKAKQKHNRDVSILVYFFNSLKNDKDRWDYIEDYFLGYDVLNKLDAEPTGAVEMSRLVDKERSYPTNMYRSWDVLKSFFDDGDHVILDKLKTKDISIPEYLETSIKNSEEGKDIMMSWPTRDTLICHQDTADSTIDFYTSKGWNVYRFYEINYDSLKGDLE